MGESSHKLESNCPLCGHELEKVTRVVFEEESNSILLDGKAVKATPSVKQVLLILIEKSPRVVSRESLMDSIYGLFSEEEEPADKIIDVFIAKVRTTIRDSNYEIETIWGKGWLFRKKVLENDREEIKQPPRTNERPCVYDTPPG